MRLTKTTGYAVRILLYCANAGDERVKVAAIAKWLDISSLNAFKIVHLLSRAGFLEAVRGRNGGVCLSRPASEIRVGDIVRAMESTDMDAVANAPSSDDGKRNAGPNLSSIFDEAMDAFISVLDQHTLADLKSKRLMPRPRRAPKAAAASTIKRSGI